MIIKENLENLALHGPDRGLDIQSFRFMMETVLHGKDFREAYGAARSYYDLYGDSEPVYFLDSYRPHEKKILLTQKDTQKEALCLTMTAHRDIIQDAFPFTMTKIGPEYDFVTGHETNYCAFGGPADFCRGFMITMGGSLSNIVLFQLDPEKSKALYYQDPDPDKRHFNTILLNLLLINGYNGSEPVSAKGGSIHFKKIIVCNEVFNIEKIIHTHNKSYRPAGNINPLGIHVSVTDENQPWNVDFDVLY